MQCKYKECIYSDNCGFLDITKKVPANINKCSWYSINKKEKIGVCDERPSDESSKVRKKRSPSKKST